MEYLFDWFGANWPLIASWGIITLVFAVYILRVVRKGQTEQLIAQVLAFVHETAKQAAQEITRDDIAYIVGKFYDEVLAGSNLAKLITRKSLVEQVWGLWQRYVRVEIAVQARMRTKARHHDRSL